MFHHATILTRFYFYVTYETFACYYTVVASVKCQPNLSGLLQHFAALGGESVHWLRYENSTDEENWNDANHEEGEFPAVYETNDDAGTDTGDTLE